MSVIKHVQGDITKTKYSCIVQQINCVTITSKGLSSAIAEAFPYADYYSQRKKLKIKTQMGECILCEPSEEKKLIHQPVVACIAGQWCPGKPGAFASTCHIDKNSDSREMRLKAFSQGLETLSEFCRERKWSTIGFPHGIGCGLADGVWADYLVLIQEFAAKVSTYKTQVYLVNIITGFGTTSSTEPQCLGAS